MKFLVYATTLILSSIACFAQKKQGLHYFISSPDSLVGVKDGTGRVIIPARYPNLSYDDMEPIPEGQAIIVMMDIQGSIRKTPAISYGDAFNRQGQFLYHPMFFDNGGDYFHEGLTRCVEKDKTGFADSKGEIVIAPQWDWTSAFNYGYAYVCNGCYLDFSRDEEHPDMAFHAGADSGYINRKGEIVKLQLLPSSPKDQKMPGGYLPYPFVYTPEEQRLVDSFNHTEVLHKLAYMNYYPGRGGREAQLRFELLEKPSVSTPYYLVQAYDRSEETYMERDDFTFKVDKDGKWFYDDRGNGLQPYATWLKKQLEDCSLFFREHPDAPNKFDTRPYLRKK